MNQFSFRHPTKLDSLSNSLKYFHLKADSHELDERQKSSVQELRNSGFTILPEYITGDTLKYFQQDLDFRFKNGKFSYPVLAQTKIDEVRDKDIIDKFLYGTPQFFKSRGLTFDKDDFQSYDQILADFNPSTLGINIPSDNSAYFNLWLDQYLLKIIETYLGYQPKMFEAYVRRNFPAPHRTMNHFWHRDLNNKFHLVKAFIFFTDCTLETGPHEYISGSHKDYSLNGKRYYSDEEVESLYTPATKLKISSVVKAGTVILEDTRGLHKAVLPQKSYRDLGYAIFYPWPWYRTYKYVNFEVQRKVYSHLSTLQKQCIFDNFINE